MSKNNIQKLKTKFNIVCAIVVPVLFIVQIIPVSAQHTMIEEDKVWSVLYSSMVSDALWTHHTKLVDGYEINGTNYYRVYITESADLTGWVPVNRYVRQEEYKVYLLEGQAAEEILSYDFGLSVGDTFTAEDPASFEFFHLIIEHIDTIELVNGAERKRWTLSLPEDLGTSDNKLYWIEGIGSIQGDLYKSWRTIAYVDIPGSLLCFRQDDITLYTTSLIGECHLFTNVQDISMEVIEWSLLPNPAVQLVQIEISEAGFIHPSTEVLFYDTQSQLVWSTAYSKGTFDVNHLPAGMYFVHLKAEEVHFKVQKLIVLK